MSEIVNLRQARKRRRRADDALQAAEKRGTHGQSAATKKARRLKHEFDAKRHEGHRRTSDDD
jgi:hypothetical protein